MRWSLLAQQAPWERAAQQLEVSFTGPLARSLALVAIVIGGLMFMFGEGGADHQRRYRLAGTVAHYHGRRPLDYQRYAIKI